MTDLSQFVGMLKTKDGREIFVDNVSNHGWNNNSVKGCIFLSGRRDRISEDLAKHVDDVLEACGLGTNEPFK